MKWVGYNELENLWLTASQLYLAKEIFEASISKNWLNSANVYDIIKCAHCDIVHVDTGKYVRCIHVKHVC